MRSRLLMVGVAFVSGLIAGVLAAEAWAATVWKVSQRGRNFQVEEIRIVPGDTIEFLNDDEYLHQIYVKGPDMNFDSAEQAPGQVISLRFRSSGTFEVRCRIHPKMLLTVTAR